MHSCKSQSPEGKVRIFEWIHQCLLVSVVCSWEILEIFCCKHFWSAFVEPAMVTLSFFCFLIFSLLEFVQLFTVKVFSSFSPIYFLRYVYRTFSEYTDLGWMLRKMAWVLLQSHKCIVRQNNWISLICVVCTDLSKASFISCW